MAGIFSVGAKVAVARREGLRQQEIDEERRRQEAEQRQAHELSRAATLASMRNAGIVPEAEREHATMELPGLRTMRSGAEPGYQGASAKVDAGVVDDSRYSKLGQTGFYQDETKTPDYVTKRKAEQRDRAMAQRVSALRAKAPTYRAMSPDALRAIAEDDDTFREAIKGAKGPSMKDANVVNPESGMVEDIYDDSSRKVIRRATADELAKARTRPRDPNAPAPKSAADALAEREKAASDLAYSAIQAANGDIAVAEKTMRQSGQYDRAQAVGLTHRHYEAAKNRYNERFRGKDPAMLDEEQPTLTATTAPARAAAPTAPAAAARSTESEGRSVMAVKATDADVRAIIDRIASGEAKWTVGTVDSASFLTPEQKRAIKDAIRPARRP